MAEKMVKETTAAEFVPLSKASQGVRCLGLRLALLHMTYAEAITEALGEEKGRKLIMKVIKRYSVRQGEKMKQEVLSKGLEPTIENYGAGESYVLPTFPGLHEKLEVVEEGGVTKYRCTNCACAELWKEYGKLELGRLYCYVDMARTMGYDPNYKFVHTKSIPDGDDYCELEVKKTTAQEREDFFSEDRDWGYMDK